MYIVNIRGMFFSLSPMYTFGKAIYYFGSKTKEIHKD